MKRKLQFAIEQPRHTALSIGKRKGFLMILHSDSKSEQSHLVKTVSVARCKHCNQNAEQRIYSSAMLQCKHKSATDHPNTLGFVLHFFGAIYPQTIGL